MHMADALVSTTVAGTMYACSALVAGYSIKKLKTDEIDHKIPVMGVMGAFVFAAQMINFTIPGTGSSGHLIGGMMLSAILGPEAAFLTLTAVLAIQCLVFADGGLMALGCNMWNMGFYGCFVGYLVWRAFIRGGMTRWRIVVSSVIGCVLALQLGAFSVTLETLASGITDLPFATFVAFMQPIHLAIGLVEGLITAAVLLFVFQARPTLLHGYGQEKEGQVKTSFVVSVMALATVVTGGFLSLLASSHPDGLEWSIEKVTGSTELEPFTSLHLVAAQIQEKVALLSDYDFQNGTGGWGTSFSGIVGGLLVLMVCVAIGFIVIKMKKAGK
ncbi:MAG: energy-coupling factor ABC transporter permease [Bacteroidaceae bacterium]|nr:energy-coupling factor ABC transporter permease [Bacteroidaceae bacterium]